MPPLKEIVVTFPPEPPGCPRPWVSVPRPGPLRRMLFRLLIAGVGGVPPPFALVVFVLLAMLEFAQVVRLTRVLDAELINNGDTMRGDADYLSSGTFLSTVRVGNDMTEC